MYDVSFVLNAKRKDKVMIPGSVIMCLIVYWLSSRGEKKRKEQRAQAERDRLNKIRMDTREVIRSRAKAEFNVDYADDELNWLIKTIESEDGEEGIVNLGLVFAKDSKENIEKYIVMIEVTYHKHLLKQQFAQVAAEDEKRLQEILEDFKRLNPDQRKLHFAYIKKHYADVLTREQLHILELASLRQD